ncbi:TFIIH basal transcription factor complex TTD-A subunit [Cryptococcus neoformans Tu401-1]|nr:TFIIH basal transcription factor complex TTD-A subunit [Cryptococcus neoformans var. grubii Tu401-1]OXM81695.1 TFIIH basal transcription factor complex TTD-A subunit [Cryptococcus neoformans var. grubii Bt63]
MTTFSRLSSARISSTFVHITSMSADSYNVKITSGVLVTCDSAAKQILLHLDSMRDGPSKFVIRDGQFYNMSVKNNLQRAHMHTHAAVDENRVMIKKEYVEMIKDELQTELEKNTYIQDPDI